MGLVLYFSSQKFQSTLPQRERPRWDIFLIFITYFNPRSHKGSDPNIGIISRFRSISIHAPTKGATIFYNISWLHIEFQSTLPQRERLYISDCLLTGFFISIHAPTKGATSAGQSIFSQIHISIHAPTKGATSCIS